ncbi:MAG: putative bifunctional diguanylate cyclase/phosphodiesterase [Acidimicrobiales bacterium]
MISTREAPRSGAGATTNVVLDYDGAIRSVSPSGEELMGKAPGDLVGVNISELLRERQGSNLLHAIQKAADGGWTGGLGQHWLTPASRQDVLVDVFLDLTTMGDGTLLVNLRDVTAEYVEEQKLRGLDNTFQHVLDGVEMAVTRWTPNMELEYHSPEFEPLVMGTHELLLSDPHLDDVGMTERAQRIWRDALQSVTNSGEPVEFDWETDDFRRIHSRAVAEYGADGFVSYALVVSHDVTEERNRYEELTRRALYDPLTGLANRATALAYMERALGRRDRSGTSEAVIFIDLDQFKAVNDSLGHAVGDELLVNVAKRLTTTLRPHDVVSRIGGDEFVVFLEQMGSIEQVLIVVDRLREAIAEPLMVAERELRVRASLGLAFAAERSETAEGLMAKADAAMYKAKEAGRDRVEMYDDELRVRAEQRMKNERALRRAMKNGEMEVHFLPEFDLETEKVVGAEALVRWQHPERGLIPAAEFIGLAEESGLLIRLGSEVLRRACELVAGWMRSRELEDFTLRVNISAKQMAQPTLGPTVEKILEDTKLDPSVLCLELSESTLTDSVDEAVKQLECLRDLGVKVSVDDFGTAASSLALLKRLPVDMLKIDRSFVVGLGVDQRDSAIVEAIVALGGALDLEVVAEGIDNEDQLEELLELGCVKGQGYLLSHVLRPNEFIRRWI